MCCDFLLTVTDMHVPLAGECYYAYLNVSNTQKADKYILAACWALDEILHP